MCLEECIPANGNLCWNKFHVITACPKEWTLSSITLDLHFLWHQKALWFTKEFMQCQQQHIFFCDKIPSFMKLSWSTDDFVVLFVDVYIFWQNQPQCFWHAEKLYVLGIYSFDGKMSECLLYCPWNTGFDERGPFVYLFSYEIIIFCNL